MLRRVVTVLLFGCLGACALSEDKVPVDYVPAESTEAIGGASAVTLEISASDQRAQYRDRIGTKKNGYGMEMARIVATNDVVDLVRSGVEQGLKAQGFTIGARGLAVSIELQNFYNNFKVGFASGTAVAEVAFALKVRNASGTLVYSQLYDATNSDGDIFLASGKNAKASLEKALTKAITSMLEDKALQRALLATAKTKPVAGRRPGA